MRSLTTHLRQPEAHGQLPFHPGCPICHTRLAGTFPTGGVLSPRTQAVLATSVLAFATTAPATAALAAEQDQDRDGTAPVAQSGAADEAENPDFDPGGESTDLPDNAPPVPQMPVPPDAGDDDTAPVDPDPKTDPSDPVADSGDGSDTSSSPAPSSGPTQPAPPTPSDGAQGTGGVSEPTTAAAPSPAPTAAADPVAQAPPHGGTDRPPDRVKKTARDVHTEQTGRGAVSHAMPGGSAATTSAAGVTRGAQTRRAVIGGGGRAAKPGDRTHTVQPGESLWAIATDLLGGDATRARVAREVHRLWQLNRDRIGTGDPDLLMVGTRLALQ